VRSRRIRAYSDADAVVGHCVRSKADGPDKSIPQPQINDFISATMSFLTPLYESMFVVAVPHPNLT